MQVMMAERRTKGNMEVSKGWTPSLGVAFRTILVARMISVFCMHISDCDETYNYWEPLHYVLFGSGFQTWEYSPVYALRSYGYILMHMAPMLLTNAGNKLVVFFLLRVVLAFFCTVCEYYFYRGVLHKFGPRVAKWTLLFLACSCGMYIAGVAFLPSSFAMYLCMVAMGAWFLENYELAIFATAISAIVGWPFSAVIGLPIAFDLLISKRLFLFFSFWAIASFIFISVPLVIIDSLYYGKLVFTPLNLLMYNVFGQGGPNLYGVEPWTFYFVNGFLNFNVVFVLALLSLPLIETQALTTALLATSGRGSHQGWYQRFNSFLMVYRGYGSNRPSYRPAVQSMVIWMAIFFTRPHKEERFLFPVYPLVCLSAGVTICLLSEVMPVLTLLGVPRVLKELMRKLMSVVPIVTGAVFVLLSLSRGYALYKGYRAPIDVYTHFHAGSIVTIVQPIYGDVNVCVGKEWYRFPSHFYLPSEKWRLRFLQSEFKGQLPKAYSEERNGTWVIPEHMNDMNKEEPSRYFEISQCHFLVDLDLPDEGSLLEPRYIEDTSTWQLVISYPFLVAEKSHKLYRAFYIPWLSQKHTTYADYVLLINRRLFENIKQKLTPDYAHSF